MPVLVDRIVVARLLLALFVYGTSGVILLLANDWRLSPSAIGVLLSLAAVGVVTTIYLLLLLRFPALRISRTFLALQYIVDVVFVAAPVALTEGTSSVFITLYVLLIVVAAMTHTVRFAITMALVASLVVAAISFLEVQGLLPGIAAPAQGNVAREVLLRDVMYFGLFFLVAVLPGGMALRQQRTDQDLGAVRRDYALIRELHRLIVDQVPSGLALLDQAGRILLLNHAGRSILANVHVDIAQPLLQRMLASADATGELVIAGGSDRSDAVLGYAVVQLDPEAVFAGHLLIFQDVSERKRLEKTLEEQKKLGALGQLAANFAHELRNPLAAISNSLQLMAPTIYAEAGHDAARLLAIQEREVARLERLVSDFMRFARPVAARCADAAIGDIIGQVIERTRLHPDAAGIEIAMDGVVPNVAVRVDPDLFQQALGNLLLNAVQWSPPGQVVRVAVRVLSQEVAVAVTDHGPGIAPEDRDHIFEPFFGRRTGGTGLGLAIVWSAMQALGGGVSVVSTEPGRTKIELRVPRASGKKGNVVG